MVNPSESLHIREARLSSRLREDPDAFIELYDLYFGRVYNYIHYRVNERATGEDLTSQVFERAFARLHTYDPARGPFAGWLFGITRNVINAHLRKTLQQPTIGMEGAAGLSGDALTPEQAFARREQLDALREALAGLDERQRDVLGLKFGARLTNRRIAELTGLGESHVAVIAYRALRTLRTRLNLAGDEDTP